MTVYRGPIDTAVTRLKALVVATSGYFKCLQQLQCCAPLLLSIERCSFAM